MGASNRHRFHAAFAQLHRYVRDDIWQGGNSQSSSVPTRGGFPHLFSTAVRGLLLEDALLVRAAALTYFTVLSLVPLLACAFSVLKGFGVYDTLIEHSVRPYVLDNLSENPALKRAFEQLLDFVARTSVTSLGTLGLFALLYAATRLIRNIEIALNEIWGARVARNPVQQVRDYVALIVITPLCAVAGFALTTFGQLVDTIRSVEHRLGLGGAIDWLLGTLGPVAVIFVGLMFLYVVVPNTRVRLVSAAVGAVVGALLWCAVLVLHVRFQVGVARFNALYAGFAAVPIFLAWLHLSWLVVLVGAKTAAAHQNHDRWLVHAQLAEVDQAGKEQLCLSAVLQIADAFGEGRALPSLAQLAERVGAPPELLRNLLAAQARAGMLITSGPVDAPTYALARAPNLIRVKHIIDALRHDGADAARLDHRSLGPEAAAGQALLELESASATLPQNRSIAELLDRTRTARAAS